MARLDLMLIFAFACLGFAETQNKCNPNQTSDIYQIAKCINEDPKFSSGYSCIDLKEGQSQLVDFSSSQSPTTVSHKYYLQNLGKGEYKATIPVIFEHEDEVFFKNQISSMVIGQKNEAMYETVNKCLEFSNNYFKGPNGQKLSIAIKRVNPQRDVVATELNGIKGYKMVYQEPKESYNKIKIHEKYDRADNKNYSESITCDVITHELLHLLGLVDEYKEEKIGYIRKKDGTLVSVEESANLIAYNCRFIGPEESVMHRQKEAYKIINGFEKDQVDRCFLKTKSEQACVNFYRNWNGKQNGCPSSSVRTNSFERDSSETSRTGKEYKFEAKYGECWLTNIKVASFKKDTFLMPAHFYSITRPGCENYNRAYYKCAAFSYKTDTGNLKDSQRTCDKNKLPPECKKSDYWLKTIGGVR